MKENAITRRQCIQGAVGTVVIHWENNLKIIWHYGYWTGISSLIIKVPEKDMTFVLMANSDMLSRASHGIGSDSDITRSVPAEEFLNGFVFGGAELPTEPYSL